MRPRILLLLFGIFVVVISMIGIVNNTSLSAHAIFKEKIPITKLPSNPLIYLVTLFLLGITAILAALYSRKVIY